MVKHKKIYIGCIVILIIAIAVFIGKRELFNEFFSPVKLQYLSSYLSNNYLYEVDEEKGMEAIYNGYLSGLENSVTYYLDKDGLKQAQIQDRGDYYGCGMDVMWSMDGQSFIISKVIKNSPADEAGIEQGDKIVKVNDTKVIMSNSQKLVEETFSIKQEPVNYTILHEGEEREVALTPQETEIEDIKGEILEGTLYIKVNALKSGTSQRMEELLKQNSSQKGVILDLRDLYSNNIDEAAKVCNLFLDKGIAFKISTKKESMKAYEMKQSAYEGKLCLITNSGTKAAAEAIVLALQDRGTVIGSETGGLKYLRTLAELQDGTGVSVASAIIYDEHGNALSDNGIEPKERAYITEEEKLELIEKGFISEDKDSFIKTAIKNLD